GPGTAIFTGRSVCARANFRSATTWGVRRRTGPTTRGTSLMRVACRRMAFGRRLARSKPSILSRTWLMKLERRCSPSVTRSRPSSSCSQSTSSVASSWASRRASPCRRKLTSERSVPPSQPGRGKLPTVVAAMGGRFIGALLPGHIETSADLLHLALHDHFPAIDPDAKLHASVEGHMLIALFQRLLHLHRALHSLHGGE